MCYAYIAHAISVAFLAKYDLHLIRKHILYTVRFYLWIYNNKSWEIYFLHTPINGDLIDLKVEISAGRMEENLKAPKMA